MVHIYGTSQSTKLIKQFLPILDGYDFSTWQSIKKFYTHFDNIIEARATQESQNLDFN